MAIESYSVENVTVTFKGELLTDFNTVTIEYDEDDVTFTSSSTGQTTRTFNANKIGAVVLTLPQASADNNTLSDAMDDVAVEKEAGTIPSFYSIEVKDLWGDSIASVTQGTIIKKSKVEYGKEPTDKEWTIKGDLTKNTVNGNN